VKLKGFADAEGGDCGGDFSRPRTSIKGIAVMDAWWATEEGVAKPSPGVELGFSPVIMRSVWQWGIRRSSGG
jgi:hypothetical protein